MEKGGQVELYISGRRSQNGWMKPKPTKSPRENAEPSTDDGPGETTTVFRLPLYSALPRCRKAKGMEETCYAAPNTERGGTRNTHQKMVPNYILLQSSVKSSKRTLSISWKRLSRASQSSFKPAEDPMSAKQTSHA